MANTRSRLLSLLANAEKVLAEAVELAAELPVASEEERRATAEIVEMRDAVMRIERMLNVDDQTE
jgi:hypothetical protein